MKNQEKVLKTLTPNFYKKIAFFDFIPYSSYFLTKFYTLHVFLRYLLYPMVKKIAIFSIKKMLAFPAISPFFVVDFASFQLDLEGAEKLPKSAYFNNFDNN